MELAKSKMGSVAKTDWSIYRLSELEPEIVEPSHGTRTIPTLSLEFIDRVSVDLGSKRSDGFQAFSLFSPSEILEFFADLVDEFFAASL